MAVDTLLNAATATGRGNEAPGFGDRTTVQVSGATTSGAGAAQVDIEVSNDGTNWIVAGTINLVLSTTTASYGLVIDGAWLNVNANIISISGTGANVTAKVGRSHAGS